MQLTHYFSSLTQSQCNMLLGKEVMLHWIDPDDDDPEFAPERLRVVNVNCEYFGDLSRWTVDFKDTYNCGVSFDFDPPWESSESSESDDSDPVCETPAERVERLTAELESAKEDVRGEAEQVKEAQRRARFADYPDLPDGFEWGIRNGDLRVMTEGGAGAIYCTDYHGTGLRTYGLESVQEPRLMELFLQGLRIYRPSLFE